MRRSKEQIYKEIAECEKQRAYFSAEATRIYYKELDRMNAGTTADYRSLFGKENAERASRYAGDNSNTAAAYGRYILLLENELEELNNREEERARARAKVGTEIDMILHHNGIKDYESIAALQVMAWVYLEHSLIQDAEDIFQKILRQKPSNAQAYLGLLCIDFGITKEDDLVNARGASKIINHRYYQYIIADSDIKIRIDGYMQTINERVEREKIETSNSLGLLSQRFGKKAIEAKKVELLSKRESAIEQMNIENDKSKTTYELECQKITQGFDIEYAYWQKNVNELKHKYNSDYKSWQDNVRNIHEQSKIWASEKLCPHCGGKKGLLGTCKVCKKKSSMILETPPQPNAPIIPDAPDKPTMPIYTPKILNLTQYPTEDEFSRPEHDISIRLDGIDWIVLNAQDGKVLLLSEKILEYAKFNDINIPLTWEVCSLRKYINKEFLNELHTLRAIADDTYNANEDNPWYGTSGGKLTTDKVFILSLDELVKYFGDSGILRERIFDTSTERLFGDKYNESRKAKNMNDEFDYWWIRTPGRVKFGACTAITDEGEISCSDADYVLGVRPALWITV